MNIFFIEIIHFQMQKLLIPAIGNPHNGIPAVAQLVTGMPVAVIKLFFFFLLRQKCKDFAILPFFLIDGMSLESCIINGLR